MGQPPITSVDRESFSAEPRYGLGADVTPEQ